MKNLTITVDELGSVSVFRCAGEIDTDTHDFLRHELDRIMKTGAKKLVLDMSGVEYVSSAGWSDFVSHGNTLKAAGGDLRLAAMQIQINDMFEIVGFNDLLNAYPTVEEAVRSFSA